jgi:hypothetical protein
MISSPPDADKIAPDKKTDTRSLADCEPELDVYSLILGLQLGETIGREEAARGRKPHGRPCEIDVGELGLLIFIVDTRSEQKTIKEAVYDFLILSRMGQCLDAWRKTLDDELRLADPPPMPPHHIWRKMEAITDADVSKCCRAYYRHRPRADNHKA